MKNLNIITMPSLPVLQRDMKLCYKGYKRGVMQGLSEIWDRNMQYLKAEHLSNTRKSR